MDELQELVVDSLPPLLYRELLEAQLTAQHDMAEGFFEEGCNHFRLHFLNMESTPEWEINARTTGAEKVTSAQLVIQTKQLQSVILNSG